ncbi:MAG: ATP phosphoribosyltransferase regulatory subunit, partial [Arenicellales bacterium]|nr:ATP phosphoribosyltransferase regulatory subunit [Arenicellales bacterium]
MAVGNSIRSIRGMNDLLPADIPAWQAIEGTIRSVVNHYGYQEIRTPVIEQTELFQRSIGEGTDIVEKEMYT